MCELIDITLDCNFKQRSSGLYLCSDIVAESYVRGSLNELLRNIGIGRRYKKNKVEVLPETHLLASRSVNARYYKNRIKRQKSELGGLQLEDLHCVLHFKRDDGHERSV